MKLRHRFPVAEKGGQPFWGYCSGGAGDLEDRRSSVHAKHSLVQMIRQRVYQSRLADVSFCLSVVDQNSKTSSTGFPVARDSLASS